LAVDGTQDHFDFCGVQLPKVVDATSTRLGWHDEVKAFRGVVMGEIDRGVTCES
jgi:hypothetical protein